MNISKVELRRITKSKDIDAISNLYANDIKKLVRIWYLINKMKFVGFHRDRNKLDTHSFPPKYKISFCINSMKRLPELERTLIKNIDDNIGYPFFELVLLNYGHDPETDIFVKKNCMHYIESGILNYYSTLDNIQYYQMCHSRNITGKLATGDIVSFIDANNFVMDFSFFLNAVPQKIENEDIIYIMSGLRRGRIAMFKKNFLRLGGYDEALDPRFWQDRDLEVRSITDGLTGVLYHKLDYYDKADKNGKLDELSGKQFDNFHPRYLSIFKKYRWRTDHAGKIARQSMINIFNGNLVANKGKKWGHGKFLKNFTEVVETK